MTARSTLRLLLLLVVVAGFVLRLWYASFELTPRRFWDERYSLENVQSVLQTGSFKPTRGFYPSPLVTWPHAGLVRASDALHGATGWPGFAIGDLDSARFSPTAYLLVRLPSVLYGAAAPLLLFFVGRRIFSPEVGLIAATALAFLPWHIRQSGVFKPDTFVVLTVLLALYWALRAVEKPEVGRYALAAFGIALALSAKILGGFVSLALAAGTLVTGWRERRRWLLLTFAAVLSLIFFFAMNPYGRYYLWYISMLQEDYAMRAEILGMERGEFPLLLAGYLTSSEAHGLVYGALALVGVAALAFRVVSPRTDRLPRAQAAMLLVYPLGLSVSYWATTPHFKGNNFLPIVPVTALAGAWVLVSVGRWAAARLAPLGSRPLATAAMGLVLAALALPGGRFVYRSLTPTNHDSVREFLRRQILAGPERYSVEERIPEALPRWDPNSFLGRRQPASIESDRLDELPQSTLDLADAEVFLAARLEGDHADFYRQRQERDTVVRSGTVESRLFERRGPPVVVLWHPWRPKRPLHELEGAGCGQRPSCLTFDMPEGVERRSVVSLRLHGEELDRTTPEAVTITAHGQEIKVFDSGSRSGSRLVTERFEAGRRVKIEFGPESGVRAWRVRVLLQPWAPPRPRGEDPQTS